ncbi:BsaA family SipW-dependent biofilm matrix protein [Vagococcus hydrophili]|uniref:Alternate signal-mediated exported protein n=1 Tax=Vagococcus hydrophili TaxID=2714947 RepID=A0A6G8ATL9_9ENTE|nr:BsaA family SipW-dependent biofilm matrix protein [Vagococcus hydrophili]QIL48431.1 hypothetical protein G7082_07950 [Vagococcus hydrophili]
MSSKSRKRKKKKLMRKIKKIQKHHRKISLVVTLLAIISFFSFVGTFAWFTSEDDVSNKFEGGKLAAEITEVFIPNNEWEPGEKTTKEVKIANTGTVPAFVRVSLYEFILNFKVDVTDQTGNGNLATASEAKKPGVDRDDTGTWQPAADGDGTFKQGNKFYIADKSWVSDPEARTGMYEYQKERKTAPQKFISLNFPDHIKTAVDPNATGDYWLYSNGYFYYSRPLKPGEKSNEVLSSLTLSDAIPNKYKGSLYKLKVYMDAHDATEPIFSEWRLNQNDPAYQLLKPQLK